MEESVFPPDLPPISNKFLYVYRVFAKCLSLVSFGWNSLLFGIFILLPMRLVLHPRARFQKYGRRLVSFFFRGFIAFMHFLGIVDFEPDDKEKYRHLSSKIIVANHPSLLDVVMLISLIPNADCVANAYLKRNILTVVVKQLYIINSDDLDKVMIACTETLKQGNCLVIFPEGTRTPRTGKVVLKKGAARISLASGCNILPIHIGGTDKFGTGKKEPILGFNPRERYVYRITMGTEISPENYSDLPAPAAAKALTDEIAAFIFPPKN
jgi:1-acyl-sn-glycerol-3-phosphate acyltransferase